MRLRKQAGWGGKAGSTGIEFHSPGERICLPKLGRKYMGRTNMQKMENTSLNMEVG